MRSSLLVLSVAVSIVLARPSISNHQAASASASMHVAAASPSASVKDLRAASWSEVKIALPDGLFPEDKPYVHDPRIYKRAAQEKIDMVVPMMEMDEADYPLPSLVHKPLYKHQRTTDGKPAYKHLGLAKSEESFDPVAITPLSPIEQSHFRKQHEAMRVAQPSPSPAVGSGRRYKNFIGLSDKGVSASMSVPVARASSLPEVNQVEPETYPNGVQQKKIVGLDKNGRMRYLDIPYYNRASSSSPSSSSSQ